MDHGTVKECLLGQSEIGDRVRWSRPSMSGQYSSALTAPRWAARRVTSRLSAFERIWLRSPWSLVTVAPSGSAIRTVGTFAAARADSIKVARKSKRCGHFRGFLALAPFPSELSTRAYARSPRSPRSVTSVAFSSSPIMDLTGYRQSETTEPSLFCAAFDILHPPQTAQLGTRLSSPPRRTPGFRRRRKPERGTSVGYRRSPASLCVRP